VSGLISLLLEFLEVLRSVNPPGKWKILVVDEHSQRLLGSVLKQFDVLEENVTLIESISNYRDPQPSFEALYLLMPTSQNVDRIIKDFSGTVKQYAGAHLFFIEGLDEQLFQRLTSSSAEPYLRGLREVFLNFWATEAQVFSIQEPAMFFGLYSPPRSDTAFQAARLRAEEDLRFAAKMVGHRFSLSYWILIGFHCKISNVCIAFNEFPFIRYYMPSHHPPLGSLKPHASTRPPPPPEASSRWRTNLARGAEARAYEAVESDHATKLLAFFVQDALEEHKKQNPDFGVHRSPFFSEASRPRATLIITDRTMDMVAPFLHEFTYQAMVNDLLPIEDGSKYTYKFQSSVGAYEDKTATLSDSDTVWTEIRHMHMREAIDKLMGDFNKFLQENAVFKGEGAASLNDMKEMLASLPQYQEQREKFSLHLNMAQECMAIFERNKLPLVANVEQCCATGVTAEGKTPKHLVEEMVPLLDSREVVNMNKVRIVALYIQHRDGVPEEDRRRLYQHARLTLAEQDAVNAVVHMGVRINRTAADRDSKKKMKQKTHGDEYELSRYKPVLRAVLEEHVAGKLDNSLFPYVKEAPSAVPTPSSLRSPPPQPTSLRSQKPSWHRARSGVSQVEIRGRILVFVVGGTTFSELRECYQSSSALNRDIYLGSTHTITPRQFVDDLKALELGGVGSKALPNGLRERQGTRTFQEYYDEKYYTKDAPPPQRAAPASSRPTPRERERLEAPKMSPTNSLSSSVNSMTATQSGKDEKKKKRGGLFRF
ncbi:Protein transport protein sec1, partial [Termitomyces sp. J132]